MVRTLALALCALLAAALPARAQDWPDRPVRFVLPGGPGSAFDVIGRILIDGLNPHLNHRLVADNRSGAGGQIAAEAAARMPADGTTLFMGLLSTQVIIPAVQRTAYDPVASFAPVGLATLSPMVLIVNPNLPARTVQEFIAYTKTQRDALNFSIAGRTALPHLLMALTARQTGMRVYPVPYSSSAQALQAVMTGDVAASFEVASIVRPQVLSGTLRALAVSSTERDATLPDVPTLAEAGIPGIVAGSWTAVYVPTGTPQHVVSRVNALMQQLADDPAYRQRLASIGAHAQRGTPDDLVRFVDGQRARFHDLAKELGSAN